MKKIQQGIGLMEVLVALLILAIAVLGFVALQLRAINASVEAGNNIHATNIARDLTERMRINRVAVSCYYKDDTECQKATATKAQARAMARSDLSQIETSAQGVGMNVVVDVCPESKFRRLCVFVAWGDTVISQDNVVTRGNGCIESGTATYQPNAQCVMVETYNDR